MNRHASMNRIYRLIWSQILNAWVAVSEISRGHGKRSGRNLIAVALALSAGVAQASPTDGQIISGSGDISQSGLTTTIQQSSQNLSLTWQSFNTTSAETVNFVQPSAAAIAVNRIFDTNGTQFFGRLNANGQVYLINPNGILFGQGAQVNVGGLVATTLDMNDDSLNGTSRSFSGNGNGSIVNRGEITAANGGYVALLGNHVSNQGVIVARLGTVALGAGTAATLTFSGNSLVNLQVDESVLNSLAENGGLIRADGGMVLMTAGAKDALLASVVNNTGVIEARTVENKDGTITLLGGMQAGTVNVDGTLDASAPDGGNGGFIETSAATVNVADTAHVSTLAPAGHAGKWLIDPKDFTIAASGGNMTGAAVTSALNGGDFAIQTASMGTDGGNGDIFVNDALNWSSHTLTLTAERNVDINAVMTATGTAGLVMSTGGSGAVNVGFNPNGTFAGRVDLASGTSLNINSQAYAIINTLGGEGSTDTTTLQGMSAALFNSHYALGSNIDALETSGWAGGLGFSPIGSADPNAFRGVFNGLGHTISNLTINRPSSDLIGLFGSVGLGGLLSNVGLENANVTGRIAVGALAGLNDNGSNTYNSYASNSTVSGTERVGGLIGVATGDTRNSHTSNTTVTGTGAVDNSDVGGLIGQMAAGANILNSYALNGTISGNASYVGGLLGRGIGRVSGGGTVGISSISDSYATGTVSGNLRVGGLVGANNGIIEHSYSTSNVTSTNAVTGNLSLGGLVGANQISDNGVETRITYSYATGIVSGSGNEVGGLVGAHRGVIENSYATGNVVGGAGNKVGGLVGTINDVGVNSLTINTINNSYATGAVTGNAELGGLIGDSTYGTITNSFWDNQTSGISACVGTGSSTGCTGFTTAQMQTQANFDSATAANGNVNPSWDFNNIWVAYDGHTSPLLRSFMTALTVTASNDTRTYNGATYSSGNGVTYSVTPDTNLLGSISYVGSSQGAVNAGSYTITGAGLYSNQQGYIISYADGTLTIDPKVITLSGSKVYDGSAVFTGGTNLSAVTGVGSETLVLSGTASTANKNVGNTDLLNSGTLALADGSGGGLASNYTLTGVGLTGVVSISQLALTGPAIAAVNTTYGTPAAAGAVSFGNVVSGDTVTTTASIDNQTTSSSGNLNAGSYTQSASTTLGGADAANYSFAGFTSAANYSVAQLALTGPAIAAVNTPYGTSAAAGAVSFGNVVSGDTVTTTASIDNQTTSSSGNLNAGSYTQTASTTLDGADAANYSFAGFTSAANYSVAQLALTGPAIAAVNTSYGTPAAAGAVSFGNVVSGDTVTTTASIDNQATSSSGNLNAGSYTQTASTTLGGADAGNYSFAGFTSAANYSVAQKALTVVSGITVETKVYDGTTSATLNLGAVVFGGEITGDDIDITSGSITGEFTDPRAGINKNVNLSGVTLSGTDAGNYTLNSVDGVTGTIVPLVLVGDIINFPFAQTATVPSSLPSDLQIPFQAASHSASPALGNPDSGISLAILDGGVRMPEEGSGY